MMSDVHPTTDFAADIFNVSSGPNPDILDDLAEGPEMTPCGAWHSASNGDNGGFPETPTSCIQDSLHRRRGMRECWVAARVIRGAAFGPAGRATFHVFPALHTLDQNRNLCGA